MTGNPFGTDVCHLGPLRPGDISVTNDLQRQTGQDRHGPDLHFLVELRGFEPLTPSMRTPGAEVAGGRWGRSLSGGSLSWSFSVDGVAVLVCCTARAPPAGPAC